MNNGYNLILIKSVYTSQWLHMYYQCIHYFSTPCCSFMERKKLENPQKRSHGKGENNISNKLSSHMGSVHHRLELHSRESQCSNNQFNLWFSLFDAWRSVAPFCMVMNHPGAGQRRGCLLHCNSNNYSILSGSQVKEKYINVLL